MGPKTKKQQPTAAEAPREEDASPPVPADETGVDAGAGKAKATGEGAGAGEEAKADGPLVNGTPAPASGSAQAPGMLAKTPSASSRFWRRRAGCLR